MNTQDNTQEQSFAIGRQRIEALIGELRQQVDDRSDFVVDTSDLSVKVGEQGEPLLVPSPSAMDFLPREGSPIQMQALRQIGNKALPKGIPAQFFDRSWEHNPQRTSEFLTGLMHDDPKRRMVRMLRGWCRAYLGQTYRAIDNLDMAKTALELALEHGAVPIECSLTDTHMRLRLTTRTIGESLKRGGVEGMPTKWFSPGELSNRPGDPRGWDSMRPGDGGAEGNDTAHPLFCLKNSETGHGGADADIGMILKACFNQCIVDKAVHQVHIGERLEAGIFTEATYQKQADLVSSKIRDAAIAAFNPAKFEALVKRMQGAQEHTVLAPSVATNVLISQGDGLNEGDLDNLLSHFMQQPGLPSHFNLGQAVSRLAQDVEPNRAEIMEKLAAKVCLGEFSQQIWKAEAAIS